MRVIASRVRAVSSVPIFALQEQQFRIPSKRFEALNASRNASFLSTSSYLSAAGIFQSKVISNNVLCDKHTRLLHIQHAHSTERVLQAEPVLKGELIATETNDPQVPATRYGTRVITFENDAGHLVYKGRLRYSIALTKGLTFFNAISIGIFTKKLIEFLEISVALDIAKILGCSGLAMLANILIVHHVLNHYVTNMYYNYDTGVFTAEVFGLFGKKRNWLFEAENVSLVSKRWITFKVNCMDVGSGKSVVKGFFIDAKGFLDYDVYRYLMGQEVINTAKDDIDEEISKSAELQKEFDQQIDLLNREFGSDTKRLSR